MSFNVDIWSNKPLKLPDDLPFKKSWQVKKDHVMIEKDEWIITIDKSSKINEEEDIGDEVYEHLPKAKFLSGISLSPTSAPEEAYDKVGKIINSLVKKGGIVITDHTSGTIFTKKGEVKIKYEKDESPKAKFSDFMLDHYYLVNVFTGIFSAAYFILRIFVSPFSPFWTSIIGWIIGILAVIFGFWFIFGFVFVNIIELVEKIIEKIKYG